MKIKQFIQASSKNYTNGRKRAIDTIVIHYTATNASALNNLKYFSRPGAGASAHYFIDRDGGIYQSVREIDTAWHAGNGTMNARSIGIENVSAGQDFTPAQIAALRDVVTDIMRRYKIPASRVIRHHDVTGKACPAPYVNDAKWKRLHSQITTPKTVTKQAPTPTQTIEQEEVEEMNAGFWWMENGKQMNMVINTNSGFITVWTQGGSTYGDAIGKAFGIPNGYAKLTESHARAIQASIKEMNDLKKPAEPKKV